MKQEAGRMKEGAVLLSPRSSLVGDAWKRAPRKLLVRSLFEPVLFPGIPRDRPGFSATISARTTGSSAGRRAAAEPDFSVETVAPEAKAAVDWDFKFDAPYAAVRAFLPSPRALLRFPAGYAEDATSELTVALELGDKGASGRVQADSGAFSLGALPFAASIVIEVEENAKARVIIRYAAPTARGAEAAAGAGLFMGSVDLRLARGASLDCVSISSLGVRVRRMENREAVLGERARLRWTEGVFDEGSGRYETSIRLDGRGAELDYAEAWAASGTTEREHVLSVLHAAEGTKSRSVLKSVLRDEARIAFRGLIEVTRQAPGTDAYLQNRNLLLDDGARVESLPQLKIDQDDVACSHGSTTGGPREDELFYLMSRGLDADSARGVIALGHLGSVLDRAKDVAAESSGTKLTEELEAMAAAALADKP